MKLNNKGFAISIIIYSVGSLAVLTLILILAIDSGIRKNNTTIVDAIKDELNANSKTRWEFSYSGVTESFTAPVTGTYRIELWGAGGFSFGATAGKGSYAAATLTLSQGDTLYVTVGGKGNGEDGGFNGGGDGNYTPLDGPTGNAWQGGGGGGATHVARESGLLSELQFKKSSVLLVAAGGGGTGIGGTGGAGGSTESYNGTDSTGAFTDSCGRGAGTVYGGCIASNSRDCGGFGYGGSAYDGTGGSGGGAGYYGGGPSGDTNSGAGGGLSFAASGLSDVSLLSGNALMGGFDGITDMFGNEGNGYAVITKLS